MLPNGEQQVHAGQSHARLRPCTRRIASVSIGIQAVAACKPTEPNTPAWCRASPHARLSPVPPALCSTATGVTSQPSSNLVDCPRDLDCHPGRRDRRDRAGERGLPRPAEHGRRPAPLADGAATGGAPGDVEGGGRRSHRRLGERAAAGVGHQARPGVGRGDGAPGVAWAGSGHGAVERSAVAPGGDRRHAHRGAELRRRRLQAVLRGAGAHAELDERDARARSAHVAAAATRAVRCRAPPVLLVPRRSRDALPGRLHRRAGRAERLRLLRSHLRAVAGDELRASRTSTRS